MSFTAKCNNCNAECTAEDEWIGQEAECPECGATIVIQRPEPKPVSKPGLSIRKTSHQEPAKTVIPGVTDAASASAAASAADAGGEKSFCPHCGQSFDNPDAVICISCGTNLKTGRKFSGGEGGGSKPKFKIWYLEVLKKYAVFKGRARRKEYWYFFLCNVIISFCLGFIDGIIGLKLKTGSMGLLGTLYSLAVFIPGLAVFVRRMHDIGKSGWWFFLAFVPCVGPIILLFFLVKDSEDGENQYGPNPKLED